MFEPKKNKLLKSNKEISADKVRLILENGDMVGIVSLDYALSMAEKSKLDLVEIAPQSSPPVCKVLDFGKFKYAYKKKTYNTKKKQKTISLKEIKFRPNIGQNDFNIKLKNIIKFLKNGNKVKVSLWFRGREMSHIQLGKDLFNRIIDAIDVHGKLELEPKIDGKNMIMIFIP